MLIYIFFGLMFSALTLSVGYMLGERRLEKTFFIVTAVIVTAAAYLFYEGIIQ